MAGTPGAFDAVEAIIVGASTDAAGADIETEHPVNVGMFSQGQRAFLDYHRNSVLLQARR
jgi:hypothetical protein